ncbi:MAG: hypothetical protein IT385_15360 [Deltaproteobacteria bacterium]|nr:hypothetical protein [Deltaproteobacteria bacterium]
MTTETTWVALALVVLAGAGSPTAAHNGFGVAPLFTEPTGLVVTDGTTPLVLRWTASEVHAELDYRFKAQATDFPPTPSPPSAMRAGALLDTLPADALSYEHALDLSSLASGAWRLYAEHDEPPTCLELVQVPALVVVRRPGDATPFGVFVSEPLVESPIVDDDARLVIEAVSPEPPSVTIEAGTIVRDPTFPAGTLCVEFTWAPTLGVIMNDVPLVADPDAGPDRWRLETRWDTRAVPDDAYLLRVTAKTPTRTEVVWSRRWVNVEHPRPVEPPPEAGPEGSAEGTTAEAPDSDEADAGCAGGGVAMAPWLVLLVLRVQARRQPTRASWRSR